MNEMCLPNSLSQKAAKKQATKQKKTRRKEKILSIFENRLGRTKYSKSKHKTGTQKLRFEQSELFVKGQTYLEPRKCIQAALEQYLCSLLTVA